MVGYEAQISGKNVSNVLEKPIVTNSYLNDKTHCSSHKLSWNMAVLFTNALPIIKQK